MSPLEKFFVEQKKTKPAITLQKDQIGYQRCAIMCNHVHMCNDVKPF